jgi:predicted O-methyltransferase YrrM
MMQVKEIYDGVYSTHIYLPVSYIAKGMKKTVHRMRGRQQKYREPRNAQTTSWRKCTNSRWVRLVESKKENGNIKTSELGVLAQFAANCEDGSNLFEIGTFDGRTTINLALNCPQHCRVLTLDLPPGLETTFEIEKKEEHFVQKPEPGVRWKKYGKIYPDAAKKIHQLLGDSAAFDFSDYHDSCSLVFVDGSHAYDYVLSDTEVAMKLVKKDGVILWHDYGRWDGVTKALDDMEERNGYGLQHIRGTTLVCWRKREVG